MALSKRNSNSIAIGDAEFRWTISSRKQGVTEMVTVVVQPPDDGSRLAVTVPCRDPYLDIDNPAPQYDVRGITPKLVHQLIDDAKSLGWCPNNSGPQFTVSAVIADARGKAGETCHVCWQCPTCNEWYSDDIEFGEQPPLMTQCGRTKHHPGGRETNVILFW
ncbi:MAG: hypothetical protein IH991_00980 [Planctomycetes bacterium]|nr:hypothetical protein [Planctomycetota bacterium]